MRGNEICFQKKSVCSKNTFHTIEVKYKKVKTSGGLSSSLLAVLLSHIVFPFCDFLDCQ